MTLSEIKAALRTKNTIAFRLPDGTYVPAHFHVTEVGHISKKFIDCGGTLRSEEVINFQLWNADDYDHRLHPEKLTHIIELSESTLDLPDAEIEVEYQGDTIQKFGLSVDGDDFVLVSKHTDCLAQDRCGIEPRTMVDISDMAASACKPGQGCC